MCAQYGHRYDVSGSDENEKSSNLSKRMMSERDVKLMLKALFNIVEAPFNFFFNSDVCVV